jgi:hypothetical protein
MKTLKADFILLAFVVCLLILGCGSPLYPVRVRVVHISDRLGQVKVLVDGLTVADRVSESSTSAYAFLRGDDHAMIEVQGADTHATLLQSSGTLESRGNYDLVLLGSVGKPTLTIKPNLVDNVAVFNDTENVFTITVTRLGTILTRQMQQPHSILVFRPPQGETGFAVNFKDAALMFDKTFALEHLANIDFTIVNTGTGEPTVISTAQ